MKSLIYHKYITFDPELLISLVIHADGIMFHFSCATEKERDSFTLIKTNSNVEAYNEVVILLKEWEKTRKPRFEGID